MVKMATRVVSIIQQTRNGSNGPTVLVLQNPGSGKGRTFLSNLEVSLWLTKSGIF